MPIRQSPKLPSKRPTAVKQYRPAVSNLKLTVNPEREHHGQWHNDPKYSKRHDVYYEGTIEIEGHELPIEVHLMSTDGSIKADRGKYYVTANINQKHDYEHFRNCPHCSGNRGVSSKETPGLTAEAVADIVMPFLRSQGYKLAIESRYKPGGWYLFDLEVPCTRRDDLDGGRAPRFYVSWMEEYTCPVHGNFLWQEIEPGV